MMNRFQTLPLNSTRAPKHDESVSNFAFILHFRPYIKGELPGFLASPPGKGQGNTGHYHRGEVLEGVTGRSGRSSPRFEGADVGRTRARGPRFGAAAMKEEDEAAALAAEADTEAAAAADATGAAAAGVAAAETEREASSADTEAAASVEAAAETDPAAAVNEAAAAEAAAATAAATVEAAAAAASTAAAMAAATVEAAEAEIAAVADKAAARSRHAESAVNQAATDAKTEAAAQAAAEATAEAELSAVAERAAARSGNVSVSGRGDRGGGSGGGSGGGVAKRYEQTDVRSLPATPRGTSAAMAAIAVGGGGIGRSPGQLRPPQPHSPRLRSRGTSVVTGQGRSVQVGIG